MPDAQSAGHSADTFDHDPLQAGLRAAFGQGSPLSASDSVLATIERHSGARPHVWLRQEPDEPDRVAVTQAGPAATCGRFPVDGEIARGGIGVILRGRDPDLGRDVAMKRLRAEHAVDPVMIQRLVEEAQIGGQLQHPGILPVYELGVDAELRPFFTMKLVRGRSLATVLAERAGSQAELSRLIGIVEQISQTVAYAHARGVIHRDLKPSNVMVGSFGEVQVVDWGLAKVLARGEARSPAEASGTTTTHITPATELPVEPPVSTARTANDADRSAPGSLLGTPPYMPPEQASGDVEAQDERSDVFALGSILCEVLTGAPAYRGSRADVLQKAARGDLADAYLRLERCGADSALAELARRCLSADREQRPSDAGAVARALGTYRQEVANRARMAELAQARARNEARIKWLAVAIAVLALALALASYAMFTAERGRAAAEASLRIAEQERREALERALQVFASLEGKGEFLLLQAAEAGGSRAAEWATLMGYVSEAIERTLPNLRTEDERARARALVERLREKQAELRRKSTSTDAR